MKVVVQAEASFLAIVFRKADLFVDKTAQHLATSLLCSAEVPHCHMAG